MNHVYSRQKPCLLLTFLLLLSTIASANIYTVTATGDNGGVDPAPGAGTGTLRQAIVDANANPGADVINFNIAGGGPFTISATAPLPAITEAVTIDGYSQPGSVTGTISGRTILINLDGSLAGAGANGLIVDANSVTIDGLAVYGFSGDGIHVNPLRAGLFVWGSYIGTDNTGTTAFSNAGHGINFDDFGPGGGGGTGGSSAAIIGTNSDGTNDADEGNLISANAQDGIAGWTLSASTIAGNIIGLDKNGNASSFGNGRNGILLTVGSVNNRIGSDGNNTSDAVEGNIISSNTGEGIFIAANSNSNLVGGNVIGLDAANAAAGNGANGINIINSSLNRIGIDGSNINYTAQRNTIGSNASNGINISSESFFGFDFNSTGNVVQGNYIGTTSGALSRPNLSNGINLSATNNPLTVDNNIIGSDGDGSTDDQEGNTIANNTLNGINTNNTPLITNDRFSRNLIFNNGLLGIDLGNDGVTPNDDGVADTGPNTLYNFPVITGVFVNGSTGNLTITGFARPGAFIEFYLADAGPNPSTPPGTKYFGEGQTYLFQAEEGGTLNGITDNDATTGTYTGAEEGTNTGGTRTENKFSFVVPLASLPVAVTGASRITAVNYTSLSGPANTSEFAGVQQ